MRQMRKKKQQKDDNVHSRTSENKKLPKEQNVREGNDIISSLPENVLHHILSFLSTKDAIRTSILSRKWEYLWTSISIIELNDRYPHSSKKKDSNFFDFVDRVLHLHDGSDIRSLHLESSKLVNSSRVNSWISVSIRRKIKELNLYFHWKTQPVLPCCLFTCESLVRLKLSMDRDWDFKVPCSTHFSNLETLELSNITFSDDNSTQHLFSSCPILQELALENCGWENLKTIMICIPTLKILTIDNHTGPEDVFSCVTNIYAPNLIDLYCSGCLMVDFHLYNLSSLVEACVCLYGGIPEQVATPRVLGLLAGIFNVKYLSTTGGMLEYLEVVENLSDRLPTFYNMTHLELNSILYDSSPTPRVMIDLLEKSPKLESLTFEQGSDCYDDGLDEADWMLGRVPSCFTSSLKTVHIKLYEEKPTDVEFIRFFLEYATVLERLTLCYSVDMNRQRQQKVSSQLNNLPKGSKSCVIELTSS